MSDKKYQVFISSTYTDLIEERRKILDVLLMADCIPAGMEAFVATDEQQFNVIKKVIDLCDYYILIIGGRYGSINPTTGISYTEMEYEYAKEKGVPVLVFAIDLSIELDGSKIEQDAIDIEKLKLFREKALKNRLASIWKTTDELTGQAAISIMRAKQEINRPGWQRAVDYDEGTLRREIMDLEREKKDLSKKILDANEKISQYSSQNDVAFDDYEIELEYYFYENRSRRNRKRKAKLTDIFAIIATQMIDVSVTEVTINNALLKYVVKDSSYHIEDMVVKKLLNQYKVLGLLRSHWSKEQSNLFWGVTTKGQKVRDDMILIRNEMVD